ncbi:MAG: enoyl-CoA hydratase-related protein [Firmicutes bacterium]|nr:enoyl-CoA hydratase-related protein [Bacillota bacterium]MDD4791535.1 enoyl-CoA hydratase-related protein [Bacillota bacterium]
MSQDFVKLKFDDGIAIITISRPASLNALNSSVLAELDSAIAEVRESPAARALIITGEGSKAFVAGADIGEMADLTPDEAVAFSRRGQAVFSAIEHLPIPTIAAVNGYALGGGCELALACDIRISSENARFGQPEVGLGIIPGFGGTVRLPLAIGRSRAAYMILTGKLVSAKEAHEMGLVAEVVPLESLPSRAEELARELGAKSYVAVAYAKRMLFPDDEALAREARRFGQCFESGHPKEGMSAFLERRPAKFSD